MAYPAYVQYGIDHFLKADKLHLQPESNAYVLKEEDTGYSELQVTVLSPNLCMINFDKINRWGVIDEKKSDGMGKGVDHVILMMDAEEKWKAYLIEMKTGMGEGTFADEKKKVRADYFKVKALCLYLGIDLSDENIRVYVTYEEKKAGITPNKTADPATLRTAVGEKYESIMQSEWNQGIITIETAEKLTFPLHTIKMNKVISSNSSSGTALVNTINIS